MSQKIQNILVSPDKFKGSMTALEFCDIAKETILKNFKGLNVCVCPLADGGEGSLDCFISATGAKIISGYFTDANFEKVPARYAIKDDIAFIELSETSGLAKTARKNPCQTTTYGFGEQILDAINRGAKKIYLSLGGSSTNDAGTGMASALGYKFLNNNGDEFIPVGNTLSEIKSIINSPLDLSIVEFITLCDVQNPLYGKNGAAYVYAKQKGASDLEIELLDKNLISFNNLCKNYGKNLQDTPGSGAAGGTGAGTIMFLNSKLISGTETFFKLTHIQEKIKTADLIITGEGKIDSQSYFGKVVFKLKEICANHNFVAFCGENELKNSLDNSPNFLVVEINDPNETTAQSILNTKAHFQEKLLEYLKSVLV